MTPLEQAETNATNATHAAAGAVDTAAGTAARRRWTLRPRARKTVTVVHVISSVALLGEVWGLVVLNLTATLDGDLALGHAAYRLMSVLVFAGGVPFTLIALASGVALALGGRWGLVRHWWVLAKLLLLLGVLFAGMLLFQPEQMAAATGDGARPSGRQWEQVAVVSGQLSMLVAAAALSVFKPRGRVARRRARP